MFQACPYFLAIRATQSIILMPYSRRDSVFSTDTKEMDDSSRASLTPTSKRSERNPAANRCYPILPSRHNLNDLRAFAQKLHAFLEFEGVKNKTALRRLKKPELAEALNRALQGETSSIDEHKDRRSINGLCEAFWKARSNLDGELKKLNLLQLQNLAYKIDQRSNGKIALEASDDNALRHKIKKVYKILEDGNKDSFMISIDEWTEELLTPAKAKLEPNRKSQRLEASREPSSNALGSEKHDLKEAIKQIKGGLMTLNKIIESKP